MISESTPSFLTYSKAIINFTYSFSWDVTSCNFEAILKDAKARHVTKDNDIKKDKWLTLSLFQRPVTWANLVNQASYHPNIISQNLIVLHKFGTIDEKVEIIVPINKEPNLKKKSLEFKSIEAELNYSIRIYENGSGNCTFTFILNKDASYENIHNILHLASTISYIQDDLENIKHLTYSWIKGKPDNTSILTSSKIFLTELFSSIIKSDIFPSIWSEKKLWFDPKVIKGGRQFNNWQSPYIVTLLQVDKNDFIEFEKWQRPDMVKEIGSIAGRLSLDNANITTDAYKIKREYVFSSLGFYHCPPDEQNRTGIRMKNYSHHSDLFYTIGKRGAIAISPDFESNPSYFVLPTLINLVEILRSRWHLGSIVNLKLDDLLEVISQTNDLNEFQDKVFSCKVLYGLFLKDPTPYLFDGGAITEIAEAGEEIFWLRRLSSEMEKKLSIIDALLDDLYSRKRYRDIF